MFYIISGALVLAALGAAMYFYISMKETSSNVRQLQESIETLESEKEVLARIFQQKAKLVHSEFAAERERLVQECNTRNESLRQRLIELDRYSRVADIFAKAMHVEHDVDSQLEHARVEASNILLAAKQQAKERNAAAEHERGKILAEADRVRSLSEEYARGIRSETNALLARAEREAESSRRQLEAETKEKREQLKAELKKQRSESEAALNSATLYAVEIRERAEKRASEVGANAYEALKNAEHYSAVADAMRNVTKGYGDRYMISTEGLLDEWAKEYGFDRAGDRLRLARDRTRLMEQNRTAATCEYAEATRREFAVNFVLDAFNGKVDSILARVKHDNFGKLRQEMKDAFHLVNFNGKAFRDARITEEYLDARVDELKWAEAVQQIRLNEREEQRLIKARIREEETARREYERAIKQAQRDEELLKAAMDKVREEYGHANAEDRAKYERQLADLEEKLREAEEKNQRAISMAQQTKCGHVYIISNIGSFGEDVFKIGLTRRLEPTDRIRELGDASVPFAFDVHGLIYSEDAPALETALHKKFIQAQVNKVNRRKEFFRVALRDVRSVVDELGIDAKWTITAVAREYRETKALEEAMSEDPELKTRWVEQQRILESLAPVDDELAELGAGDPTIDSTSISA
jgi:hypothetical protein